MCICSRGEKKQNKKKPRTPQEARDRSGFQELSANSYKYLPVFLRKSINH